MKNTRKHAQLRTSTTSFIGKLALEIKGLESWNTARVVKSHIGRA
jgi:hypothetical protein